MCSHGWMVKHLKRTVVGLAVVAASVVPFAGTAHAYECIGFASPSAAIHMTSLGSVNGGYWETLWGNPYVAARYVQDVYAYGVWIEAWVGNGLYLVPASRAVTSIYGC